MKCDRCGRLLIAITDRNVRCPCGHLIPAGRAELPCVHRGEVIGTADCGCAGKPKVYQCGIHRLAMDRKLKPGMVPVVMSVGKQHFDMAYCNACPQKLTVHRTLPVDGCAIITTHYNPAGFSRLDATLEEWLPTMPEGVIVEHGDGGPENIMWQKERLINRAIERLPDEMRTVAWVDHDIVFENPNWLVESQRLIDDGIDCVQPFSLVKYQDRAGKVNRTARGAASVSLAGGMPDTGPGAAWVASRDWLQSIGGLYDRNIVGGGDATFFEAVSKQRTKYRERQSEASKKDLGRWVEAVGSVRYGCLPGAVRHLWHGDFGNRQYVSRDAILRRFEFDPDKHVEIDSNGLLAWTDAASQGLRDAVAGYFAGRREDG
jgi:hypothetical protein